MKNYFKILLTLIIGVIISISANAQWQGPGVTGAGNMYFTNGNVGIGTTGPLRDFHIKKTVAGQVRAQIENEDTGTSSHGILSIYAKGGDPFLHLLPNSSGTGEWSLGVDNSDSDKLKIGSSFTVGSATAMTIDHNLNVGIGTTSPTYAKLQVKGGATHELFAVNRPDSDVPALYLGNAGNNNAVIAANNSNLTFGRDFGGTYTEYMRIQNNTGNVGIGTTSPAAKLDVEGGNVFIGEEASSNGTRRYLRVFGYDANAQFYGTLHSNYDDSRRTFDISTNDQVQQIKIDASARSDGKIILSPGANGNVGIGTTSPDKKFTVQGDANIGGTGNGQIKVRHIDGKSHTSTGYGHLYLNYSSTSPVTVGTASNQAPFYAYGNVGIGTPNTFGYKLAVNGTIGAKEVNVEMSSAWPDYVFAKGYNLKSLADTESYIKEEGHLPNIPSAQEVSENGIQLGEMNAKLLQKIEELTLHLISQQKRIEELERKVGE